MTPVRTLERRDVEAWGRMRAELWRWADAGELMEEARAAASGESDLTVFIADQNGDAVGFLELSLRSYAEGCSGSPVPYIEGWFVAPAHRGEGYGAALVRAAEEWSRARGYDEIGSDTESANIDSRTAHAALGFEEVETIVVFRKALHRGHAG